jgi:flagellar biogenesis protein FliO
MPYFSSMKQSRKLFLFIALIFALLLIWVVWDFSRRTEMRRPAKPTDEQRVENSHTYHPAYEGEKN